METLARHNSPLIMSQCGSKGSAINIAQVCVCVGDGQGRRGARVGDAASCVGGFGVVWRGVPLLQVLTHTTCRLLGDA